MSAATQGGHWRSQRCSLIGGFRPRRLGQVFESMASVQYRSKAVPSFDMALARYSAIAWKPTADAPSDLPWGKKLRLQSRRLKA